MITIPPFSLKDIDGQELQLGDRVFAFEQEYESVVVEEDEDISIVEIDRSKPLPLLDVPLYIGRLTWDPEFMQVMVKVERTLVEEPVGVTSFPAHHYVYQKATNNPVEIP